MQVTVNGEVRAVPDGVTLREIVVFLELDPSRIAVELDRNIVKKDAWAETPVADGARLEIVMFVGGG
jgi:sulfur carrier protein